MKSNKTLLVTRRSLSLSARLMLGSLLLLWCLGCTTTTTAFSTTTPATKSLTAGSFSARSVAYTNGKDCLARSSSSSSFSTLPHRILASSTTALFHMGHSHAHHDHSHSHSHTHSHSHSTKTKKKSNNVRWMAMWVVCWLATCGKQLVVGKPLQSLDWTLFWVTGGIFTSADKLRRFVRTSIQKLSQLKDGIVKHSGSTTTTSSSSSIGSPVMMQDTKAADRVTWIGVVVNILLSVGKLVVGITNHSSALIADAGHSLSDLISDFITLWSVQIARLPPDDDHPYGHFKFESLGSLFLSLTLLATGVSVGSMANQQLLQLFGKSSSASAVASIAGHGHVHVPIPGTLALIMAGISIASKEWLFRITRRVGEKLQSSVVLANAWHHRSDAYSSVLALGSIAMARAGFPAADAAAGLLVAGMICMTGGDILVESIQQLSDSANTELQQRVATILDSFDEDVQRVLSIRARQVGSSAFCDVVVETSTSVVTTTATRAIEERLKTYIVTELQQQHEQKYVTVTVHAKPPKQMDVTVCPLLQQQHDGDTNDPITASASTIEFLVRQKALLLYPTIQAITGVTVHYSEQNQGLVDVQMVGSSVRLPKLQRDAKQLKRLLEESPEIRTANIYLDVLNNHEDIHERLLSTNMLQIPIPATAMTTMTTTTTTNSNSTIQEGVAP